MHQRLAAQPTPLVRSVHRLGTKRGQDGSRLYPPTNELSAGVPQFFFFLSLLESALCAQSGTDLGAPDSFLAHHSVLGQPHHAHPQAAGLPLPRRFRLRLRFAAAAANRRIRSTVSLSPRPPAPPLTSLAAPRFLYISRPNPKTLHFHRLILTRSPIFSPHNLSSQPQQRKLR